MKFNFKMFETIKTHKTSKLVWASSLQFPKFITTLVLKTFINYKKNIIKDQINLNQQTRNTS